MTNIDIVKLNWSLRQKLMAGWEFNIWAIPESNRKNVKGSPFGAAFYTGKPPDDSAHCVYANSPLEAIELALKTNDKRWKTEGDD